ncbi:hypothetical protein HPP92_022013 [Vanilla planifolia]|uniref:Uncharacterized protein n=1 Tax=Vanilla planifolia TaxID=51239 RepID=A0A835Q094_VANPL|nr:hypothetical protein HPP92_022013 [Vanilla planifolia]
MSGGIAVCGILKNATYTTPSPPITQISGLVPPPVSRIAYLNALGGDGSYKPNVHATTQAPRRKFMDEGKIRKGIREAFAV